MRGNMAAFLNTQLDFVLFFYGLAFILFGAVCFAIGRRERQEFWGMLGLFGVVHVKLRDAIVMPCLATCGPA
jgi:hypothetical protein